MSVGKFAFLPNLRNAAAAQATLEGVRFRLSYDVEVLGNGNAQATVPVEATLKGPGDVIGIAPDQITRIEPEDANRGFEPNYFPFIQLRDADLPWRYSLSSGTGNRLMPWVVLIALKDSEFSYINQGQALAPRIEINAVNTALPDLSQAWATAHVQVDMDGETATPAQVLASDSGRGFSRLFACRKLESGTQYTLFMVPSYRVGLDAALGEEVNPALGEALAWDVADAGTMPLPYFFKHRFKTEVGQDLETLLRKLRAVRTDEADEAGGPIWVSGQDVGYYPNLTSPGYRFAAEAALKQPDKGTPKYDTPEALANKMALTLGSVLTEVESDADEPVEDPLLTFPAYGAKYVNVQHVKPNKALQNKWFDRVNLDLRYRAAAGWGRKIVRENDEHFAQLCWEQYDEVLAANQALRQLQVAAQLAGRMQERHFSKLPNETGVQLSEPMMGFVRTDPKDDRAKSLRSLLDQKNLPRGYTSLALRRTLSRKSERTVGKDKSSKRRIPMAALPGDQTPTENALTNDNGAQSRRANVLSKTRLLGDVNKEMSKIFNPEMLGRKPRPKVPQGVVGSFSSEKIKQLVGDKLAALPKQKADHLIGGRSEAEVGDGGVIYRAPRVPVPMIDYLMRLSRASVLPNVRALPENTVSFYEENREFVEALMLGANDAMNEELRWREYPTDMRGTIFNRFWNRGAQPWDKNADDIGEIRDWDGTLGSQDSPADADGKANLVVVIKGEVVRKLNDPLVVISIANGDKWDPETATEIPPVFFGKIGRDSVYYGFDVARDYIMSPPIKTRAYFAIYEPPARLRFGLDVGNAGVRDTRPTVPDEVISLPRPDLNTWDDLSWRHMRLDDAQYVDFSRVFTKPPHEPINHWSRHKQSAGLARSFWQKPLAALLPLGRVL